MNHGKGVLGWMFCAFIVASSLGCAVPGPDTNPMSEAGLDAGTVYQPKIQPGDSFSAARKELAELLKGGLNPVGIRILGQPILDTYAGRPQLGQLVKDGASPHIYYDQHQKLLYVLFNSMVVREDRIEVSPHLSFFFTDLLDQPIAVVKSRDDRYPYEVPFRGMVSFYFHRGDLAGAQRFVNSLYTMQQWQKKSETEQAGDFESIAAQYRALKVKPPVSEEQRKFIVQANAMGQQKEYAEALGLYLKAVELDRVSYPAAYFNMALLAAQLGRYKPAITYMKQYLLLEPEAKDARSAHDKIYEWEFMLQRKKQ